MKPSKLQRIAAMMTARAGAYFFIIESYAKVICWCKPLKRIIYACPPMAEKLDISIEAVMKLFDVAKKILIHTWEPKPKGISTF